MFDLISSPWMTGNRSKLGAHSIGFMATTKWRRVSSVLPSVHAGSFPSAGIGEVPPRTGTSITAYLDRARWDAEKYTAALESSAPAEPESTKTVTVEFTWKHDFSSPALLGYPADVDVRFDTMDRWWNRVQAVNDPYANWTAGSFKKLNDATTGLWRTLSAAVDVPKFVYLDETPSLHETMLVGPSLPIFITDPWTAAMQILENASVRYLRAREFAASCKFHVLRTDGFILIRRAIDDMCRPGEIFSCTAPILRHGPPARPAPDLGAGGFALAA